MIPLDTTLNAADTRADDAIAFCVANDFPLGAALIAHRWRGGAAEDVITALAPYQNDDGGFGNGLEVDIASPASNPFATRLAMQVLLALDERPDCATAVLAGIERWLASAQDDQGDFRLSPAVLSSQIAPWFAEWTYPNLNPAACLTGLAFRLGAGSPELFSRVEAMVASLGNAEVARDGEFYDVLPYAEYAPLLAANGHETLLEATVEGIVGRLHAETYDDASHALDHALGGGEALSSRIPADLIAREIARLLGEQEADGGWSSPYSAAWRPWVTATALVRGADIRDMSR